MRLSCSRSLILIINIIIHFYFIVYNATSVVTIIGSTGTIGRSLLTRFTNSNNKVYASFRDQNKAKQLLNHLKDLNIPNRPTLFHYDLEDMIDHDLPGFGYCSPYNNYILINSAGICIEGNSLLAMKQNININFKGTIKTTNHAIHQFSRIQKNKTNNKLTIINISSGDGERCYLHTNIAEEISNINTINALIKYSNNLIITYNNSFEYAYGDSPMYSLSKALLNRYIELTHLNIINNSDTYLNPSLNNSNIHISPINIIDINNITNDNDINRMNNIYIFACCPGNIASPMSTEEELLTLTPLEIATNYIYDLAIHPKQYQNGRFYRNNKLLNW